MKAPATTGAFTYGREWMMGLNIFKMATIKIGELPLTLTAFWRSCSLNW